MRLPLDPSLPLVPSSENSYEKNLAFRLNSLLRNIAQQLNGISEGAMSVRHSALTSAPTSGTYATGDFVANITPSELGTAGSKYIIHGWQCVASGSPGSWVQCRFMTGN